jgi:hypothetical protein
MKEKLCQVHVSGKTWTAAYREVYKNEQKASLSALKKDPWVIARVAELQAEAAGRAVWNLERLIEQFQADHDFAVQRGHASAAVQATMHIGKALGLYVDKREVRMVDEFEQMSVVQLREYVAKQIQLLGIEPGKLIEHMPDESQED